MVMLAVTEDPVSPGMTIRTSIALAETWKQMQKTSVAERRGEKNLLLFDIFSSKNGSNRSINESKKRNFV
jgi:hypothetical protein